MVAAGVRTTTTTLQHSLNYSKGAFKRGFYWECYGVTWEDSRSLDYSTIAHILTYRTVLLIRIILLWPRTYKKGILGVWLQG